MPERLCICGNKLSSINRSLKCYECRERDKREKRSETGQKRLDEAKAAHQVRLHSCLSSIHDAASVSCMCRKFITFTQARQFINLGRAVDFHTREASFHEGAVVEVSRLKNPPISTLGSRIAIERKTVHPVFDEKDIARLKATADEDKLWRAKEQECKIDIENDLARASRAEITKEYSDKEWRAVEEVQRTLPAYVSGVGHDERTPTGKKRKFRTLKRAKDPQVIGMRPESAVAAEQSVELVALESVREAA